MGLDEVDEKILKHLTMDARFSARQLALKIGISTATVLSRIKRMEKDRIIRRYTAVVDHEGLGYTLTAVIGIVAKKDKIMGIEKTIAGFENVCCVYDVTGPTDTMIVAKFKRRDDLSRFVKKLATIPDVENTITHVVLNTVKEDFRLI